MAKKGDHSSPNIGSGSFLSCSELNIPIHLILTVALTIILCFCYIRFCPATTALLVRRAELLPQRQLYTLIHPQPRSCSHSLLRQALSRFRWRHILELTVCSEEGCDIGLELLGSHPFPR